MNPWRWLWGELKAVGWPVVFFDLNVGISLLIFSLSVLFTSGMNDIDNWVAMLTIVVASLLGVLFGQLISLLRIRSSLFLVGTAMGFFFSIYLISQVQMIEMAIGETMTVLLVLGLMIGSLMASGGFWSLRVNRGILANWAPLLLSTSSILMVSENTGAVAAWHEGNKYGIWNAATFAVLVTTVTLQLAYLAARERHRLHRWHTAPVATEEVYTHPDPIRPLRGCGTWIVLGLLVLFLTFSSAVVAPYLWRTAPTEGGSNPTEQGDSRESREPNKGSGDEGEPEEGDHQQQGSPGPGDLLKYVEQGVQLSCALFTLVVLALAGLLVFGLPIRRQVLLSHLRDPMWPVSPTRQAHLHWRLAEIALGDAGLHREPSETALDLARRGLKALPEVNLEALATAGEIADRVAYGYALEPTDVDLIGRAAEMTYQAVWEQLSEWERLKATYRML